MSIIPKKQVIIKVIIEKTYIFDEGSIDGRTTEDIIQDWFKDNSINMSHPARDYYHIGNGDKVLEIAVDGEIYTVSKIKL